VGSSPSTFVSSSGAASETVRNVERVTPISGQSGELSADEAVAKGLLNSTGWCARGANNILSYYTTGRGMATSGANAKNMGPILQQRYSMSKVSDTGVYQNGDTKVMTKDGCPGCAGHIETYMNGTWYSDHKQRASLEGRGYTATGLFRLPSSTALGGDLASAETAQEGAEEELPPVNPSGIAGGPNSIDTNMKLDPNEETAQYEDGAAGTSEVATNANGTVDQESLRKYLTQAITNSRLNGYNPSDGAKYGVDGSVNSWVNHFMSLAKNESGFRNSATNNNDPGGSLGLYQVSTFDGSRYGANPTGRNWTTAELRNPTNNAKTAIAIYERNVLRDGAIVGSSGKGAGGYFAKTTMNRMANEAANGTIGDFDPNALVSATPTIQHPTPFPRNDGPDTNYQALGMFGYASEGTAVWCFFREGNPLFPVYFAASYGQKEWSNMYSYGSPGLGAGVGPKGALDNTEKMRMSLYGGGFESAQISEGEEESSLEANYEFQVYGKNGSNLLFAKDHTQFNSTYNHNQRVSGDFHEITEANKEERVRGDKNSYIEQDVFITVGNWSQDAIEASDEIQEYINEAMKIKSDAGG
jgi:hypothetical protein